MRVFIRHRAQRWRPWASFASLRLRGADDRARLPVIRGGMIFTFYKARGLGVGSSLVEDDSLELAKKLEVHA